MHYFPGGRRVVLGTSFVLVTIVLLTYKHSYSLTGTILSTPVSPSCQTWLGWQDSSSEQSTYVECKTSVKYPLVGDTNVLGNPERCLSASSRLNQYSSSGNRNWSDVRWGQVQRRCAAREYKLPSLEDQLHQIWRRPADSQETAPFSGTNTGRTAVVLRTWDNYEYTEKRLTWLRALITEVALQRNGAYQVFFLVNVKDTDVRLEEDDAAYEQFLIKCVPEEFRDMAVLFNERTLKAWYPKVTEHGAQDQMYQALQIFSHKFPQYDHVWQLEMDLRFTDHVHDSLESAITFAKAQRRRNLWERNGRFYIPQLHNNSYENFADAVDAEIGDKGVWGPMSTSDFVPRGPQAPARAKLDWGIGEDADLISFMPMFDPVGSNWIYEDYVYGFADGTATPRRVAIVSITRSSRRLLQLVSEAQRETGRWVVSEATLETFALLHGLKAVTVPHPISFANEMKVEELDADIHKGPPHTKAGGESSMLYTKNGFLLGPWWQASYWFTGDGAQGVWEAYVDGQGLPPMLLHPVKEK
ncbi:hypothetical protein GGR54DRAFT_652995 [Hypoxylon sp. NC1633]|nr:hypothetical protein GGR54DRAFT_652995 [Hypoxylon sp. NC1633]